MQPHSPAPSLADRVAAVVARFLGCPERLAPVPVPVPVRLPVKRR